MSTVRLRVLDLIIVALLAVAVWLAYTGFNARTTVPTYNTPSITDTPTEAPLAI